MEASIPGGRGGDWPQATQAAGPERTYTCACLRVIYIGVKSEQIVLTEVSGVGGQGRWGVGGLGVQPGCMGGRAGGPSHCPGGRATLGSAGRPQAGSPERGWPRGAVTNQSHSSCEPLTRNGKKGELSGFLSGIPGFYKG